MGAILMAAYGAYLVAVGIKGNAPELMTELGQEKQFIYWAIAFLIIAGLWELPVAEGFAKSMAALIVLGFLLHNSNYAVIGANLKALLNGTQPQVT